jgi:hypothetical protein
MVESCFCRVFITVTRIHPPMGRKLFYSNAGFGSRAKMLRTVMDCAQNWEQEGMQAFWTDALKKAEKYATFRNLMVHGDVVRIGLASSKYAGQYIILRGQEFWKSDPDPNDVITREQLATADRNVRLLAQCMMSVLAEPSKVKEWCELIALLPSQPQSGKIDAADLARFPQGRSIPFQR